MIKLKRNLFLPIFILFSLSAKAQTGCSPDENQVIIQIHTDDFAFENSYELRNSAGIRIYDSDRFIFGDRLYIDTFCIPKTECLTFILKDIRGNGLCCNSLFEGYYKILINNELYAEGGEFDFFEFVYLECSEGEICEKAIPVSEGIYETEIGNGNNWYEFIPDTSGLFNVSTCFPENSCNTTIWAYGYCNPANEFLNVQGTLLYSEDECGIQAETQARMLKGNTYYLRIGSTSDDCRNEAIKWQLEFLRAEVGCTDSLACNYNPAATIDDGSCIYSGDPDCPDGPDLVMGQREFELSLRRDVINTPNTCLREEGCLTGYGPRTVIRFDTEIENQGEKDFFVGSPPTNTDVPTAQWEFDNCHNHWHYEGYARYLLFDEDGVEIPIGFKNGFCVLDLECPSRDMKKFTCEIQGLSVGCKDIYDYFLDCQWIDITDVPDGKYTLVSVVNWDHSPDATGSYETDYSNNWAQVCIEIFRDTSINYIGFQKIPNCDTYVDCLGIPNGTALSDCEGNCNGSIKKGDIIRDGNRDLGDVAEYISASLSDNLVPTECNDLNLDGKINVADVSLILECFLHDGASPQPGHGHAPCEFSFAIENQFDSVWLKVGHIDLTEEYVDIEYRAPYGRLEAFEFDLSGVKITSVQSLNPDFQATIEHEGTEILGLSFEEKSLPQTNDYQPFIRVLFEDYLNDTICIEHVEALVNENLELMLFAGSECNFPDNVSTQNLSKNDFYSAVIPNPMNGTGQLIFENESAQPVRIDFFSLSGKNLKSINDFRGDSFLIEKGNLPPGVIVFRIIKEDGISVGRIISSH